MIELIDINKTYGDKLLFRDYNLTINTSDKVLLSAPSGSGKTTLVRMMMGFELPDSGEIIINSLKMDHLTLKEIHGQIAYVSQDTDLNLGTVREQLDMIFTYKINRHIDHYLESFKSQCHFFALNPTIVDEQVVQLSGGERQRVALIIALLLNRPYIILDEITSGLDNSLKKKIADFVMTLKQTVIIVSHDMIWQDYDGLVEVAL